MHTIAFLGTGLMGRPMAANLIRAGHRLRVWNRTRAKTEPLVEMGAHTADSPADAARGCEVVITMLSDGPAVADVLFEQGTADAIADGTVVIDMSSIPPPTARDHAQRLARRGIVHVDAPVSGGTGGARDATLAIMAGAEPEAFERVRDLLSVLGRPTHVGPPGSGQLAKCCNQAIVAVTIGAVAEALLLAAAGGADPAAVREALSGGFADSRVLREHGQRMLKRDFEPGGPVRLQSKDLKTALAAADVDLPLTKAVDELFDALGEHGGLELDHSALLLELERMNAPLRLGPGD